MRRYPNSSDSDNRNNKSKKTSGVSGSVTPFGKVMIDRKYSNPSGETRMHSSLPPVVSGGNSSRDKRSSSRTPVGDLMETPPQTSSSGGHSHPNPSPSSSSPSYVITSSTPRKELLLIIEDQQKELQNRLDSLNAVQRNFIRLSEMYKKDSEKWQRKEEEQRSLSLSKDKEKEGGGKLLAAMKEELKTALEEVKQLREEKESHLQECNETRQRLEGRLAEAKEDMELKEMEKTTLEAVLEAAKRESQQWKEQYEKVSRSAQETEEAAETAQRLQRLLAVELEAQLDRFTQQMNLTREAIPTNENDHKGSNPTEVMEDLVWKQWPAAISAALAQKKEGEQKVDQLRREGEKCAFTLRNLTSFMIPSLMNAEVRSRSVLQQGVLDEQSSLFSLFRSSVSLLSRVERAKEEALETAQATKTETQSAKASEASYTERVQQLQQELSQQVRRNDSLQEERKALTDKLSMATTELSAVKEARVREQQQQLEQQRELEALKRSIEEEEKKKAMQGEAAQSALTNTEQLLRSAQQQNEILMRELDSYRQKWSRLEAEYSERVTASEQSAQETVASTRQWTEQINTKFRLSEEEFTIRSFIERDEVAARWSLRSYFEKGLMIQQHRRQVTAALFSSVQIGAEERAARQYLVLEERDRLLQLWSLFCSQLRLLSVEEATQHATSTTTKEMASVQSALQQYQKAAEANAAALERERESWKGEAQTLREALEEEKRSTSSRDRAAVAALHKLAAAEQASETSFSCPTCFQLFSSPVTCVPCGHTYCRACLYQHPRNKKNAPPLDSLLVLEPLFCAECGGTTVEGVVEARVIESLGGVLGYKKQVLQDILTTLERKVSASSSKRTSLVR